MTYRGEELGGKPNQRQPWIVRWEFRAPSGEMIRGAISASRAADLDPFTTGDELVVLYDPAEPRCNTLWVP